MPHNMRLKSPVATSARKFRKIICPPAKARWSIWCKRLRRNESDRSALDDRSGSRFFALCKNPKEAARQRRSPNMNRKNIAQALGLFFCLTLGFSGLVLSSEAFAGSSSGQETPWQHPTSVSGITGQETPWQHLPTYISGMKCGEGGTITCKAVESVGVKNYPFCCTPNTAPECVPEVPIVLGTGAPMIVCIDDPSTCFCDAKDCGSSLTKCSAFYIGIECHKKCSLPNPPLNRLGDQ